MRKRYKILFVATALIVLLPMAIVIFIATFDWNRLRPWLQSSIGDASGRSVVIDGDLVASWHWQRRVDGTNTWSPGLGISAAKVRIGNPAWAKGAYFAQLQAIELDLRLLPLLWHEIAIPSVRLVRPSLDIERRQDRSDNMSFAPTGTGTGTSSAWSLNLGQIQFDVGNVTIADAERGLDLHADISALDAPIAFGQRVESDDPSTRREVIQRVGRAAAQRLHAATEERAARATARDKLPPPPYVFAWKATGTLRGAAVTGNGRFGGVLALTGAGRPFPVRADIEVGATEIALTGTITDPASPDAIDMLLWISGPNLAEIYQIAGLALPNTPAYATVGRLAGRFHPHQSLLRYENFTARVGGSDLDGTLIYKSGEPRATLTGDVESTVLQFKDLGALVGADSAQARAERGDKSPQPSDRVLPSEPFNVAHWSAMDADVHFTGKRVFRTKELPIQDVDTRIVMRAAVLTLDPLRFGMAGGTVTASLRIDANAKPAKGTVAVEARKLQLRRLFEKVDALSKSIGEINGSLKLAGSGNSIAALFGSSDGSLKLLMTDGKVSETLMEEAGLNVANIVLAKLAGDKQISIDCAAADLTAKDGVLGTNLFVFDTDNAVIDIDGHIRLSDERVDLTLHPHTKGLRVFSLRSPLHVEGSFQKLNVSVDKKALLARGATAVGLGLVAAPLAALLPLTAPNADAAKSCAPLIARFQQSAPGGARKPNTSSAAAARSNDGNPRKR